MSKKRRLSIALAAGALVAAMLPGAASAGPDNHLWARLSGANEVPPVATSAHGKVKIRLSQDESTLTFKVKVNIPSSGLTGAHIHQGAAGVNGPIIVDLLSNASRVKGTKKKTEFSGTVYVGPAYVAALLADPAGYYVNVHTTANPSGEVRGQLASH